MALNAVLLAIEISDAMGYDSPTLQLTAFAQGVVQELIQGIATFGGVPSPHTISGLVASRMAAQIQTLAGYPSITTELTAFCQGVVDHIMTSGIVTYSGPPLAPPVEPIGWYLGGTISGLDGNSCAELIKNNAGYPSVSAKLLSECTAITDHIQNNAQVETGVIS